ncbi:MAG: hypothetical protein HQK87_04655 [Nitrospinae bacterium]|nr:hypothetical protein [Nitrospinota bacterium]
MADYGVHPFTVGGVPFTFTTRANSAGEPQVTGLISNDRGEVIQTVHYEVADELMRAWRFGTVEALRYLDRYAFVHTRVRMARGEQRGEEDYLLGPDLADTSPEAYMMEVERQWARLPHD